VNQELSRVQLSPLEKVAAKAAFWVSKFFSRLGGKLVVYARKP
jgi:hypothetical protein